MKGMGQDGTNAVLCKTDMTSVHRAYGERMSKERRSYNDGFHG